MRQAASLSLGETCVSLVISTFRRSFLDVDSSLEKKLQIQARFLAVDLPLAKKMAVVMSNTPYQFLNKGLINNTSQCQPLSPTAFVTTPWSPNNTLVCLGRTASSSSSPLVSSQLQPGA
jgi:hypothetical protein